MSGAELKAHTSDGTKGRVESVCTKGRTTFLYSSVTTGNILNSLKTSAPTPIANMQIFVRGLSGRSIAIDIAERDDIPLSELNKVIMTREGIPVEQQRLVFSGKQLTESLSLQQQSVRHGSVLELSASLSGGAPKAKKDKAKGDDKKKGGKEKTDSKPLGDSEEVSTSHSLTSAFLSSK